MITTDLFESQQQCPECGGPAFSDLVLAEKKDACYNKVRSRYKVWPSAYASGALVQCRKKGAANWGNKSESVAEGSDMCHVCGQTPCNCTYITENHNNGEYSDEAGMAHGNLITIAKAARGLLDTIDQHEDLPEWVQEKIAKVEGMLVSAWNYLQSQEAQGIDPRITEVYGTLAEAWSHVRHRMELVEEFDIIERVVEGLAVHNGVAAEAIWEDLESLTDDELYVFAVTTPIMEDWQKVNKRDKTDGMSQKAVNAYRREHPGSKLKTAVTTKPSKLKKGSKASKRRKSYCSRSRGQMKMHHISCAKTPDKAICKARRRWNCESLVNNNAVIAEMDTQQPKGRIKSDGTRSHSTYGSRDHYSDADPQHVAKPTKAEKMMKHAHDVMMKSMSTADKVEKGWRNPNIDEGSDSKSAGQAIQKLQSFAKMNPDFTLSDLERLPSHGMSIKQVLTNAMQACDSLKQQYLSNKQPGNAKFIDNLKSEIKWFLTDRTQSQDPATLGELLQGTLGKVNFQQGVAEGLPKAVPSSQRDPGALATRSHIASQEKAHTDWAAKQKALADEFYKNHPELDDRPKPVTQENSMADELARMAMRRNPNALVRKDGETLQSAPPGPKPAGTTTPRPAPEFDPVEYSDDYSVWSKKTQGLGEGINDIIETHRKLSSD